MPTFTVNTTDDIDDGLVPQDNELASEINARWWKPPHLIREQQFAPEAPNGILYSPFGVHYR